MSTTTMERQFKHVCNYVKGGPVNHRLEFAAPVASASANIYQGSLVSLDSNGKFVLGLPDAKAMPMWSKKNIFDPDVTTSSDMALSTVGGMITAYVATGGCEIETTEFVAGTYAPNAYLTAASGDNLGKVTTTAAAPYSTTAIVGVVSAGIGAAKQYGVSRLAFWPVFLPGTSA